jgi:hypothetical protein
MRATAAPKSDPAPSPSAPASGSMPPQPAADLHAQIAERAYLRAEQRGFVAGYELDDWLAAEAEIKSGASAPPPAGAA